MLVPQRLTSNHNKCRCILLSPPTGSHLNILHQCSILGHISSSYTGMVGAEGNDPSTPVLSGQCSTSELCANTMPLQGCTSYLTAITTDVLWPINRIEQPSWLYDHHRSDAPMKRHFMSTFECDN